MHGSTETLNGTSNPAERIDLMRQQAVSHGLEARTWHVPVFACDELATPERMPLFLSLVQQPESV